MQHDTPQHAIPEASSVTEIRRRGAQPIHITLPETGAVVHVRRPSALELVAEGVIPEHLTSHLLRGVDAEESPKATREFVEVVNAVCCAALISPRMASPDMPRVDGDVLTPDDLPLVDRLMIYEVVKRTEGVFHLARFPGEAPGGVAPVADEPGVPDAPVEPGRPG